MHTLKIFRQPNAPHCQPIDQHPICLLASSTFYAQSAGVSTGTAALFGSSCRILDLWGALFFKLCCKDSLPTFGKLEAGDAASCY